MAALAVAAYRTYTARAEVSAGVAAVAEAYPQSDVPDLVQQCIAAGALIIR